MKNEGPFAPGSADLFSENAKTIRAQIAAISFRQLLNTELDELARAGGTGFADWQVTEYKYRLPACSDVNI
jgi:hypothetical protein